MSSEYDAARSKVRKLVDRPSEDPQKLPRVSYTLPNIYNYRLKKEIRLNKKQI